ncbi:MAG TPA: gluconate 2-dehydrogenase subunit 3 family protein [Thermomicrobiales bacterium]
MTALAPSPTVLARTLAAFVETLLPGDDRFPPASAVGAQELLADRLRERFGASAVQELAQRLDARCSPGVSFAEADPSQRTEAVRRLQEEEPGYFSFLYSATCYAYYASPVVTAAIRALGHEYNDAPQPEGYALPPFDFTPGVNVPRNPRGFYKQTNLIERIDISELADLGLPQASGKGEGERSA